MSDSRKSGGEVSVPQFEVEGLVYVEDDGTKRRREFNNGEIKDYVIGHE